MIIAHIIGINSYLKSDFVNKINEINEKNEININVIDLDEITKKLLIKSNFALKPEDWKQQMYNELNNCNANDKKTIVIGLTNFINDNRYKIKLETDNYFFIDIPIDNCVMQIITHNLDTHRQTIINGTFPLKFLDIYFIMDQRIQLENIYEQTHQKIKYYKIISWINEYIKNNKILYITSLHRYETKLDKLSYAYNEEWLSLSSIANKSMISRGIVDGKPIIIELQIGGFAELNKPGYVYEMDCGIDKIDSYRTKITNLEFNRRRYVSNILDELKRSGVIFEKFKYK